MAPVKLKDVAEHMDMSMDGMDFYLHRKTGELELVEGDVLAQILDGETPHPMYGPKESVEDARRVAVAMDDYVELPKQNSRDGYRVMEDFCATIGDDRIRARLEDAIRGKGAFSRFKDMIHRTGVEKDWYAFRDAANLEAARAFLEGEGIPYEE